MKLESCNRKSSSRLGFGGFLKVAQEPSYNKGTPFLGWLFLIRENPNPKKRVKGTTKLPSFFNSFRPSRFRIQEAFLTARPVLRLVLYFFLGDMNPRRVYGSYYLSRN